MLTRWLSRLNPLALGQAVLALAVCFVMFERVTASIDLWLVDHETRLLRERQPRQIANDVVVVGMDESFLDSIREPIALMHPHLAKFLQAMAVGRPSVVGLDVIFPRQSYRFLAPTDAPGLNYDLILMKALLQTKTTVPIVMAKTWDADAGKFRDILIDYVVAARQPGGAADADARGSAIVCPDDDAIVRRFPGEWCQPEAGSIPLSTKMAAFAGNRQDWSGYIDFASGAPYSYVPLVDVLRWLDAGDEAKLRTTFGARPVLLGPVLAFEDRHYVPVELAAWEPGNRHVPGVLIHAQALRSMMNTGLLQPTPLALDLLIAVVATLVWWIRSPWRGGAVLLVGAAALLFASTLLLSHGLIMPVASAMVFGLIALAGRFGLEAIRDAREKNFLRRSFSGSVSPQVMKEILSGRIQPGQQAGRTRACVLFADIRGFTKRGENMQADRLIALLNKYFTGMTAAIHRNHGAVDKFIGDGLMALFGAPEPLECPERNAMEAAQDMLERLVEINRDLVQLGEEPLRIGIGIHSGELVVGYVGSSDRNEYTAIGDVVNVASRLEGMTKSTQYPIVCSESVAAAVGRPEMLVDLGEQPVPGRSALRVFGWNPALIAPA